MSLNIQFQTLLTMVGMGFLFGIFFDTYTRFFNKYRQNRLIIFVYDLLFWMVQALFLFFVLYKVNYGEIHVYLFLALLCGYSCYQACFKKIYQKILEMVIWNVRLCIRFVIKIIKVMIIRPLHLLIIFIFTCSIFVVKAFLGLVNRIGIMLIWMIQILLFPLFAMVKYIWSLLPNSVHQYGMKRIDQLNDFIKGINHTVGKYINLLQSVLRLKK